MSIADLNNSEDGESSDVLRRKLHLNQCMCFNINNGVSEKHY